MRTGTVNSRNHFDARSKPFLCRDIFMMTTFFYDYFVHFCIGRTHARTHERTYRLYMYLHKHTHTHPYLHTNPIGYKISINFQNKQLNEQTTINGRNRTHFFCIRSNASVLNRIYTINYLLELQPNGQNSSRKQYG